MHLDFLRPMYDEIGDYVSVYTDTDRSSEHANDDIAVRWQHARQQLAQAGAGEESLQAVAEVTSDPDRTSTATVAIGPRDSDIAASPNELLELGLTENQILSERADSALVRAAVRTDAELHFLSPDLVQRGDPTADGGIAMPRDGVAAAFRFSLEEG